MKKPLASKIIPIINVIFLTISLYLFASIILDLIYPDANALSYMTTPVLCLVLAIETLLCIPILFWSLRKEPNFNTQDHNRKMLRRAMFLNVISILIVFCTMFTIYITKAMQPSYITNHSFPAIQQVNQKTPHNDYSELKTGDVVVLYKFGCPDCEGIYDSANNLFLNNDIHIKWVSSETPNGQELCEKYNITWTPTGIYFRQHPLGNGANIIQEQLDTVVNKETVLNEQNAQTLINAYKNNE